MIYSTVNFNYKLKMGYYEIFVYGTLKHGEPNHFILQNPENGNSSYLGKARTSKRWPLVIASQYNIPYLLFVDGTGMVTYGFQKKYKKYIKSVNMYFVVACIW